MKEMAKLWALWDLVNSLDNKTGNLKNTVENAN